MATRVILALACLVILLVYASVANLKGIGTDEGVRLSIINGGRYFSATPPPDPPTWDRVLQTGRPYAYQPLYYLLQNSLMRLAGTQDVSLFRAVNLGFLGVALLGLLALSRDWRLGSRVFLLGVFSFNAYLLMHVLQIREYIVGVACYIWSTWLVLQLDRRQLGRNWADVGWFAAYGAMLTAGFFVQSWMVFPALGQFVFLTLRRRAGPARFFTYLALSYGVVLALAWPYLVTHTQRADVGQWGTQGTPLGAQVSDGFHLVLSGHVAGQAGFWEFLFWLWPAVVVVVGGLLFAGNPAALPPEKIAGYRRQGWLMLLCIGVSLAFQIAYFLKVDTLSVWPRYFVVHYFFATWLVALAFNALVEWHAAAAPGARRRTLALALGALAGVAAVSAVLQTRSYFHDPYLDTGTTRESNWRLVANGVSRAAGPRDTIMTADFISRATLTFSWPTDNPVILLSEIESLDLEPVERLLYLEPAANRLQRDQLVQRMTALGFIRWEEIGIPSADGKTPLAEWRILAFVRR